MTSISNIGLSNSNYITNRSGDNQTKIESIVDKYDKREFFEKHDDVLWKTLVYEQIIETHLKIYDQNIRTNDDVEEAYQYFSEFVQAVSDKFTNNPSKYKTHKNKLILIESTKLDLNTLRYKESQFLIDDLRWKPAYTNCVGQALVYIALGQKLGWDIYPVIAKKHVLISFGNSDDISKNAYYEIANTSSPSLQMLYSFAQRRAEIDGSDPKQAKANALYEKSYVDPFDNDYIDFTPLGSKNDIIIDRLHNYGAYFSRTGQDEQKAMIVNELYFLSKTNPKSVNQYSIMLAQQRKNEDALILLNKNLSKYDHSLTHYNLYQIYYYIEKDDLANYHLNKAIEIDPEYRERAASKTNK